MRATTKFEYGIRLFLLVVMDMATIVLSYFLGLWIRFEFSIDHIPRRYIVAAGRFALVAIVISIAIYYILHLYHSIWRFASVSELFRIILAYLILAPILYFVSRIPALLIPLSVLLMGYVFSGICCLFLRFGIRMLRYVSAEGKPPAGEAEAERVLLIGAGQAAHEILKDIQLGKEGIYKICAIVDDNPLKQNRFLEGVRIEGTREDIPQLVKKHDISRIIFAIPTAPAEQRAEILNICKDTGCRVQTVPGISQLLNEEVRVTQLRDVEPEDLLGREVAHLDTRDVSRMLLGKVVLVTGGGGSIGSELCRQIATFHVAKLVLVDIYENNAYDIQQELKRSHPELDLSVVIASVRDSRRINQIFEEYKPDVVFHAAAHKHVPLMEGSPDEAIKNNVFGTYKTAYAAMMNGCSRFVLISTDKAVNPTNIMGASKRMCEMIVQSFDHKIKEHQEEALPVLHVHVDDEFGAMPFTIPGKDNAGYQTAKTEFVAVRFGNVLGSNGSVIPLFKKQIAAGGPVTVTHPDIIRYFMTIPEAVSLVLQAGTYAKGGEIFVLDMGAPVKIDTLARNLIKLSGYKPDVDIRIEYTGLRPGEKLYEEKLMAEEGLRKTPNAMIHIGNPIPFDTDQFLAELENLMQAAYENDVDIRSKVQAMVSTYHPAGIHGSEEKGSGYQQQIAGGVK